MTREAVLNAVLNDVANPIVNPLLPEVPLIYLAMDQNPSDTRSQIVNRYGRYPDFSRASIAAKLNGAEVISGQPRWDDPRNLLTDNQASAETDASSWIANSSATITSSTTEKRQGGKSVQVQTGNAGSGEGTRTNPSTDVPASQTYTGSVWVKGSGTVIVRLQERDAADANVGYTDSPVITLTNDWQRIVVTRTFGATGVKARIHAQTNVQQGITFWIDGAQIEKGSTATEWVLPSKSYGLWVEESTTNRLLYSDDCTNAAWTTESVTLTANATTAPDGSNTAVRAQSSQQTHNIRQQLTVVGSTTYTFSFWVRNNSGNALKYSVYDWTNNADIVAATAYTAPQGVWTLVTLTFTTPATCTSAAVYPIRDCGVTVDAYLWRAQVEQKAHATTPHKTTSATATRAAESVTHTLASPLPPEWTAMGFVTLDPASVSRTLYFFHFRTPSAAYRLWKYAGWGYTRFQQDTGGAPYGGTEMTLASSDTWLAFACSQTAAGMRGWQLRSSQSAMEAKTSTTKALLLPRATVGVGCTYNGQSQCNGLIRVFCLLPRAPQSDREVQSWLEALAQGRSIF